VNLAGVEVILNMTRRIEELQAQLEAQQQAAVENERLRQRVQELERRLATRTGETLVVRDDTDTSSELPRLRSE